MSGEIKKLSFPDGVTVDAPTDLDVGGSGAGETNYNSNPNAETSTSGYITYIDAPAATPVDGTGGTSNLAFTRTIVAAEIIRGTASFKLSKDAVDRQGEGVSFDFAIDQADENKLLKFEFEYQTSSGYASDDIAVFIYDVDNAIMMTPSNNSVSKTATATTVNRHSVQWASSDSTNYRAIIHIASTSAVAYTMQFDNVVVGPGKILTTPAISGWSDATSIFDETTFSNATGLTISATNVYWRRVGDSIEFQIQDVDFTGTGTDAVSLGMSLDFLGLTFDFDTSSALGSGWCQQNNGTRNQINVTGITGSPDRLAFVAADGGGLQASSLAGIAFGNVDAGDVFSMSFEFVAKVFEWSGQGTTNALVQDNLSEWTAYTPTITAGITGNAFGKWRRVGDSIEVRSYISVSGATGGTISISIPSGLTTDTSKLADSAFEDCVGDVTANDQGTSQIYGGNVHVDQSNTNRVRFRRIDGGGSGGYWTNTVPFAWSSSDEIFCNFTLPIVEYAGTQGSLVGFSEAGLNNAGLAGPLSSLTSTINSGTWTPTHINTSDSNIVSVNPAISQFIRVGSIVYFSLRVAIQTTSNNLSTTTNVSVPIVSDFDSSTDVIGTGDFINTGVTATAWAMNEADPALDTIRVRLRGDTTTTNTTYTFTGSYIIK